MAYLFYVWVRKVEVALYYGTIGYPSGTLQQVDENTKVELRGETTAENRDLGGGIAQVASEWLPYK